MNDHCLKKNGIQPPQQTKSYVTEEERNTLSVVETIQLELDRMMVEIISNALTSQPDNNKNNVET